jgi:hypothetical protein
MIENFKSKIRQFLPMSFLSKFWSPRFRPGGPLFVTRITRGFLEKKAFSRNPEITVSSLAQAQNPRAA